MRAVATPTRTAATRTAATRIAATAATGNDGLIREEGQGGGARIMIPGDAPGTFTEPITGKQFTIPFVNPDWETISNLPELVTVTDVCVPSGIVEEFPQSDRR